MLDDFLFNISANLASDLLEAVSGRLRELTLGGEKEQALNHAFRHAFARMLQAMAPDADPVLLQHLQSVIEPFAKDQEVATQLVKLALGVDEQPIESLRTRFEMFDVDIVSLDEVGLNFNKSITAFLSGLGDGLEQEAAKPQSALYNSVSLELLIKLREAEQGQYLLVRQVLDGQSEAKYELEQHLANLEGQLDEIRVILTDFARASDRRNLTIIQKVPGSSTILMDSSDVISLVDGGRLAQWWNEIGPDPEILLSLYLDRMAQVFAPLYFPLSRRSKPILMRDVYIDLPILKPPTEEALLQPQRVSQRLGREFGIKSNELLQQSEQSALVGILGMGKTTTFRYLTWIYAQRPEDLIYWRSHELVPFYARLRDLGEFWTLTERMQGPHGFMLALSKAVCNACRGVVSVKAIERVLEQALDEDNALILLDALDELHVSEGERLDFVTALQELWRIAPFNANHILLTSRPYAFLNPLGFDQYLIGNPEKDVERLVYRLGAALLRARNDLEATSQIEPWLRRLTDAISNSRLREFWSPFYITLMVYLGTKGSSVEEGTTILNGIHRLTDLYWYFLVKTTEWEKNKLREPSLVPDENKAIRVFGYTAYYTFVEPMGDRVADAVTNASHISEADVHIIIDFWLQTGLLYKDGFQQDLNFWHTGFRSFGVALALADMWRSNRMGDVLKLRERHLNNPEWDPIWPLFTGLAGELNL